MVSLFISVYRKFRCKVFNFDVFFFNSPSKIRLKPSSLTLLRPKVNLNSWMDKFLYSPVPINLQHLLVISSFFQRCNPTLVNLFIYSINCSRLLTPLSVISQKAACSLSCFRLRLLCMVSIKPFIWSSSISLYLAFRSRQIILLWSLIKLASRSNYCPPMRVPPKSKCKWRRFDAFCSSVRMILKRYRLKRLPFSSSVKLLMFKLCDSTFEIPSPIVDSNLFAFKYNSRVLMLFYSFSESSSISAYTSVIKLPEKLKITFSTSLNSVIMRLSYSISPFAK